MGSRVCTISGVYLYVYGWGNDRLLYGDALAEIEL